MAVRSKNLGPGSFENNTYPGPNYERPKTFRCLTIILYWQRFISNMHSHNSSPTFFFIHSLLTRCSLGLAAMQFELLHSWTTEPLARRLEGTRGAVRGLFWRTVTNFDELWLILTNFDEFCYEDSSKVRQKFDEWIRHSSFLSDELVFVTILGTRRCPRGRPAAPD